MSKGNSSKSQLFLMEFICVILFFALCAALCLNAFVKAEIISKNGQQLNEALILAQSMAENIKSMDNPTHAYISNEVSKMNNQNKQYRITVKDKVFDDMLQADILVYHADNSREELCNLEVMKYLPGEVENAD